MVLGSVWLMCRSVYLSGLLMSHGTDSVRTRRATTENKRRRTMRHYGRLKLNNIRLIASGKLGESLYQSRLLMWKMNKLPFLEHHPFVIAYRHFAKKRSLLKQTMSLRNCHFVLLKQGRRSLISVLYLELFLGGLIWGEREGGRQRKDKRISILIADNRIFFSAVCVSTNSAWSSHICQTQVA